MNRKILAFDFARGFTVLLMPAVHTVLVYSLPQVQAGSLGMLLQFIAEGPGAQLFMFVMGFGITTGHAKSWPQVLRRSFMLLTGGYLLNFFRLILPALAGIMPAELVNQYIAYPALPVAANLLLTGDILQFAAIGYLLLHLLQKLTKYNLYVAIFMYLAVSFLSPFLWGLQSHWLVADHLAALFTANDHRAFFPVFPWIAYPIAGWLAGNIFKQKANAAAFKLMFIAGITLLITGVTLIRVFWPALQTDFYRPSPGAVVFHTGFVMLWVWLAERLRPLIANTYTGHLLIFCSRHITLIYFVQWILIAWGIGIFGYRHLGFAASVISLMLVSVVTMLLVLVLRKQEPEGRGG